MSFLFSPILSVFVVLLRLESLMMFSISAKSKLEKLKLSTSLWISHLIADLIHTHQLSAARKGVQLTAQIDHGVYPFILGDFVRIRQLLSNFLSNAIKFTSIGTVSLTVHLFTLSQFFTLLDEEKQHSILLHAATKAELLTSASSSLSAPSSSFSSTSLSSTVPPLSVVDLSVAASCSVAEAAIAVANQVKRKPGTAFEISTFHPSPAPLTPPALSVPFPFPSLKSCSHSSSSTSASCSLSSSVASSDSSAAVLSSSTSSSSSDSCASSSFDSSASFPSLPPHPRPYFMIVSDNLQRLVRDQPLDPQQSGPQFPHYPFSQDAQSGTSLHPSFLSRAPSRSLSALPPDSPVSSSPISDNKSRTNKRENNVDPDVDPASLSSSCSSSSSSSSSSSQPSSSSSSSSDSASSPLPPSVLVFDVRDTG